MPRDTVTDAFLGVSASLTGRRWIGPTEAQRRRAEAIGQHTDLPPPLCQILARLGPAPDECEAYLAPRLRDLMPDPRRLHDMDIAAARLSRAVEAHHRIAIFADYDVDGGASAALLIRWLRALGRRATLYVPDRLLEGYGPNPPAMARLAEAHDLIICVDCGTLAHEALAAAKGTDLIVLDHHLGGETLPPALAVVNPNRADEGGELGHLCAASVVFLTLVEAGRQRREAGLAAPDLIPLLDLVALATVADVAPLVGVNRAFVRQGLAVMASRAHPGLVALAEAARLQGPPTAYHLGFVLGPRINAGGRVGGADLGARLLATDDPGEASDLAGSLEDLNTERRAIEAQVREEALAQAQAHADRPVVWAAGAGWHPGVLGIVASRLKETFGRPAIVIGTNGREAKGSGRSIAGIDLGSAIQRLVHEGLLTQGGGHRMAAGLSLSTDGIGAAMDRLGEIIARQGDPAGGRQDLRLDALLMPGGASLTLAEQIDLAGPFGAAAPAPRFAMADMLVRAPRRVGESHLAMRLSAGGGPSIEAMCFGAFDGPLGAAIEARRDRPTHLAGRLEINRWQGRETVRLRVEDIADPAAAEA